MFQWLGRLLGGSKPTAPRERPGRDRNRLAGRYESAETNSENEPLWRFTDYLSARAANSFQVRRTLKIRSRYEASNNSYFRGIVDTLANDLVGRGPRLQVRLRDTAACRLIQDRWHSWTRAIGLANKLRVLAKAKIQDGEGFGLLVTNRNLPKTFGSEPQRWDNPDQEIKRLNVPDAVQLDVVPIESDQVTTPDPGFIDYFWVDGMVLDRLGNPTEYHVLRHHPGDLFIPQLNPLIYDRWKPGHVLHWFRKDRPGQVRGVPEITPALDLFAQLRRYTKAVIAAAETAADVAAFLETNAPANVDPGGLGLDPEAPDPLDVIQFHRGQMLTLPWGTKLNQLRAEQPATTYEMFVRVLLREICRCLQIPLNIAMGDSSNYNFASGRLDHLPYHRHQRTDRQQADEELLDKIFAAWLAEAVLIEGYLPEGINPLHIPHRWFWDSAESINPVDDANAETTRLSNGTTTHTAILAERGEDFETMLRNKAKEVQIAQDLAKEFNVPLEMLLPSASGQGASSQAGSDQPGTGSKRTFDPKRSHHRQGAQAQAQTDVRAGEQWDEDKHPRADNGQFGSGSSSAKTKEKHDKEKSELSQKHEGEKSDLSKKHEKEKSDLSKKHEDEGVHEEDRQIEHEELSDRHQEERDEQESRHEEERDEQTSRHEDEMSEAEEADEAEQQKHQDKWTAEDEKTQEKRDNEDEKITDKRDKEDEKLQAKRDKEDSDREARHEKLVESKKEKLEAKREKEDEKTSKEREKAEAAKDKKYEAVNKREEKLQADREKADKAQEKQRVREDKEREARQKAEVKALDPKEAQEDVALKADRQKAHDEATERQKTEKEGLEKEITDGKHEDPDAAREELEQKHSDEHDEIDSDFDQKQEEQDERHAQEAEDLQARHEQEDQDVQEARDKEDEEEQARRDKEDKDLEAEANAIEDQWVEQQDKWNEEDKKREEERSKEDDEIDKDDSDLHREYEAREAQREAEDKEIEARRGREDQERQSARDKEDHDRYHARKAQHTGAHEWHYSQQEHAAYSKARKEESKEGEETKASAIHAVKDDSGHEHDKLGRFGSGGGSSEKTDKEKGSKEDKENKKADSKPEKHDTGKVSEGSEKLGERAKGLLGKVKEGGKKAVAAAKAIGRKAKELAYEATYLLYKYKVYAEDICDTTQDYANIYNAGNLGADTHNPLTQTIANHLGVGVGGALATKIAAAAISFGITKIKQHLAKRAERKAAEGDKEKGDKETKATLDLLAAEKKSLSNEDMAKVVVEILGLFLPELGYPDKELPDEDDVLEWLEDQEDEDGESESTDD